jgi:hypothetical protein
MSLWRFLHQRQDMAVRILKERHPEIGILHGRDEVRLAGEGDPAPFKFANSVVDVMFESALSTGWRLPR